jgi:hypothetical protein
LRKLVLMLTLLVALVPQTRLDAAMQTFDSAAAAAADGWVEHLSRPAEGFGADYGFSPTNNTTAPSGAGEGGGLIPDRTQQITYYADTTGISFTESDAFVVTGWLRIPVFPADGGVELGFFDPSDAGLEVGGVQDFAGMRILDGNRIVARIGAQGNLTTLTPADANAPMKFTMTYEPVSSANQAFSRLLIELRRASDDSLIDAFGSSRLIGTFDWNLTAFGLLSLDFNTTHAHSTSIFIDDISIVPEPASVALLAGGAALALRRRR